MPVSSQVTFLCLSAPGILGGLFGFREIDTQFVRESTHVKRYQVKWNLETARGSHFWSPSLLQINFSQTSLIINDSSSPKINILFT